MPPSKLPAAADQESQKLVQEQLQRIVGSATFQPVDRLKRFLTFIVNEALSGLAPWPYGLTNLALLAACAIALFRLARVLGLQPTFAVCCAALWAFNFHAVNMALLWLSGRTSLLMTLFSLAAALLFLRRRPVAAALLFLCALLSKEDAVTLPLIVAACLFVRGAKPRDIAVDLLLMGIALAVYFALRVPSHAFTPATGYEPGIDIDGIELRDRVWLALGLVD